MRLETGRSRRRDAELMLVKQITWEHDQRRTLSERMGRASTPFERFGIKH